MSHQAAREKTEGETLLMKSYEHLSSGSRRLFLRRTLLTTLLFIIIGGTLGYYGVRRFELAVTYHPEPYAPGESWRLPAGGEDVWFTTADGIRLHGWFVRSRTQPAHATILYAHGNGGNLSYVGWLAERLAARRFDVLLFDYRGYGRSEGELSEERGIYADADAAYEYLVRERGVRPEHLVLYGQSLGTTVVTDVASRKPCGALILESGLSSASAMAAVVLPWLPRWMHSLGMNRFDSAGKLANVHCPVLITHGDNDSTIPVEQAHALYAAARDPKRLVIIPDAGHNVAGFGGDAYLGMIANFIRDATRALSHST